MGKDPAVMFTGRATADPARDGQLAPDLATRARTGDKQARDALVERYAPLIWSICCTCRLGPADARDAGQSVWPRLADQLDNIRDPAGQELLAAERHAAVREALSRLPPDSQQLIAMLIADPPVPYAEISARLGIPVGSIGPHRSRCLDKPRRDPVIAALINAAHSQKGS